MREVLDANTLCDCGEWKTVNEPVDKLDDGYAINGCCGGGCYVISGILYCPFCGKVLK